MSYIYWLCYQYKISLFNLESDDLDIASVFSVVLAIWSCYGVYVGFLQFMVGYDNKEKGTYLGYQKMDFLTDSNVWYHLTNSWEFIGSLLLSIIIPLIVKFNASAGIHYQYIWQAIIGFLLILFIFLLKFSLKVAKTTIFINKNTDGRLKEFIESDIENRYHRYFNRLLKQKFSHGARKSYFKQVRVDLSKIDNAKDKSTFLEFIYCNISSEEIIGILKEFEVGDIFNYKCFIKEKYELISHINCEDDELICFATSLFKLDVQMFDKLIKKNIRWIENDNSFKTTGIFRKKEILGVEYNSKVRNLGINWYEYSKINNIHFCMFEILAEMAKNKQTNSYLISLVQKKISKNNVWKNYWETDIPSKIFIFDKLISDSNLRISKEYFRKIKKIDVYYSSTYPDSIDYNSDTDSVYLALHSNILKIDFHLKNGEQHYVQRNEIRDYYNEYEEKVWNIIFDKYRNSDDLSDVFLPDLREPEMRVDPFDGGDEIIILDYDNKLAYSRICFKYLTDNHNHVDSSTSNFTNLIEIVKTMSINYRGAFALYQLLHPETRDWDSSDGEYIEILVEIFKSSKEKKEKLYSNMISIIDTVEYGEHVGVEILKKVFDTRDIELIDDEFLKDFKGISKLKLIVVQSILSTSPYGFRRVELQERWGKQDLVDQYIRGLSITPNIFPTYTYDYKTLNSTMSEFLIKNIELLSPYEFSQLPLSSLLLLEEFLYRKWGREEKHDEQEFMVNLIKKEAEYKSKGYSYSIYGSLLKFFTLKLIEGKGNKYLKLVNDKDFKKEFKFSLLNHLKRNQLTLDMYLDGIDEELKNYDSVMIGICEKELIKREVEKIIFENYLYLG